MIFFKMLWIEISTFVCLEFIFHRLYEISVIYVEKNLE
jgi:hypothetical protein